MEKEFKKVFLAANSAEGFVQYFKNSYDFRDGWRAYIIKGGPGTGKSGFMMKVARKAGEQGLDPVLCFCSSDPDSLDGVIIEERKTVLLDGTPPHTVEPQIYGVCEQIINLGEYLDCEKLRKNSDEIIALKDKNMFYHRTASRYIAAFGELYFENLRLARQSLDSKKTEIFSKKLCDKYIKPKAGGGGTKQCFFLSGITPRGTVNFTETVKLYAEKTVITEDKFGAAAGIIMQTVINFALLKGYKVLVLKNPFFPGELADGVIIPELSLCFACENEYLRFDSRERRIHSERFYDAGFLKSHRNRIFFNRRVGRSLLLGGISALKQAKSVHDEIEKYYIDAMDFEKTDKKIADFIANELVL